MADRKKFFVVGAEREEQRDAGADGGSAGADFMSRAEAIGLLARMAARRNVSLEEVRALQVAVRCLAKRLFDTARWFSRRQEGQPEKAVVLQRQPGQQGQPRQPGQALRGLVGLANELDQKIWTVRCSLLPALHGAEAEKRAETAAALDFAVTQLSILACKANELKWEIMEAGR